MSRATALLPDLSPLRRHRSFRLLWFGQLVSNAGTQVRLVALPYQIYALTGSPFHVGLLGLFQAIPLISLPLLGGVLADRADRRRVLIATQSGLAASSLVLAIVTQAGFTELWILYALTAISASFSAFDQPARGALVPTLVERTELPAAIALNQMLFQSAAVIGPAIGGVVIASYGVAAAYWLDAISFAAAIGAAVAIKAPRHVVALPQSIVESLVEGVTYVVRNRLLLSEMVIDLLAMFFGSVRALMPFYAEQVFKVGAQGLGLLFAAPGVGALIAVLTSGWVSRVRRPGLATVLAVCAWGIAIAAFGLMTEGLFVLALVLVAFAEAADVLSAIFRNTILQGVVREELRGRLTAIHGLFVIGGPNLGQVRAGAVGALVSPQFAVISGGLACVLSAIAVAFWAPELPRYDRTAAAQDRAAT
ncbi:MAG TPA: MFS transporter [Candidatus Limnocylindria bacterium]|nr:MFS transporter [Candidatus Limnocylindria bacterium]